MKAFSAEGKLARVSEDFRGNVMVAGDIHGDFEAFGRIVRIFEAETDGLLIFLGDYADRGGNGLEVIEGVRKVMEKYGNRVIALKGNHEDYRDGRPYFSPWNLAQEVEGKMRMLWSEFYPRFERDFLSKLYLAAVIPNFALCVHGGVSSKLGRIEDLVNPNATLEEDILWSDPRDFTGEGPNIRGAGVRFGPDVSEWVLRGLGVKFLIRGHEPKKVSKGPYVEHYGRVFTNSATRVYGGRDFALKLAPDNKSMIIYPDVFQGAFVMKFRPDPEMDAGELRESYVVLFQSDI